MRFKQKPKFLPVKSRMSKYFYFSAHFSLTADPLTLEGRTPRKRKLLESEGKQLSSLYPYVINLLSDAAPYAFLLQTISLPTESSIVKLIRPHNRITLHFNNTGFLLLHQDDNVIREYFFETGHETFPLLFAASSNQLDVYFRITEHSINLDICVKPRCISLGEDLPIRAVSKCQYQKIHDFVTLQLAEQSEQSTWTASPHMLQLVYERRSETQSEFVALIKLLYDCAQLFHEEDRSAWDLPDMCIQRGMADVQLRRYQIDAVKWMIRQESGIIGWNEKELLNSMFIQIHSSDRQQTVFYSPLTGTFSSSPPKLNPPSLGGILADEMGLGKTLEVIALILNHPWLGWPVMGGRLYTLDGCVCKPFEDMDAPTPPMYDPEARKPVFCSCGDVEQARDLELVQCTYCQGPLQHAACMQYEPSIYLNKLPIKHGYICPKCWSQLRIESKATLIVAPDHIWQQWKEELQNHVTHKAVDVLLYAGMEAPVTPVEVGNRGPQSTSSQSNMNPYAPRTFVTAAHCNDEEEEELIPGFVQPAYLACADIVLTSYSVVQRESDWAEVVSERQSGLGDRPDLRLAPRYLCRPSPLTCVRWWRVCLDEAQMVERITSRTARMMSKIEARHRWCVTGTPAEKSIDDLFGLFAYLRYEPFSSQHYWNCMLYQPFLAATAPSWIDSNETSEVRFLRPESTLESVRSTQLAKILSPILWRNTKMRVYDQLSLPPISEQIHWISFTPVERYIHDRVLAQSASALDRLSCTMSISLNQPLASLPGVAHWRLVYLITRLRQACTHASLVVATGVHTRRRFPERNRFTGGRRSYGDVDRNYGEDEYELEDCVSYQNSALPDGPSVSAARAHRNTGTGCFTMTEVIRRVVDETRRECENLLRSWVFNKNGAAGCFIIKEQFEHAAECYRDVLRTADSLEMRHGVLADWSQRLHAITNLHWLIQSRGVPLLDEPAPPTSTTLASTEVKPTQPFVVTISDSQLTPLDPRVDRDLLAKAQRLRNTYIEMHSHLLAKVHEILRPVVNAIDLELESGTSFEDGDGSRSSSPYGASWLSWLSDALHYLNSCGLGSNIVEMLVASFQGKPGSNRTFRSTLLHVKSVDSFRALLLTEVADLFEARKRLHESMHPVVKMWEAFKAGNEPDQNILRPFYACCARLLDPANEDTDSTQQTAHKKKLPNKARELKQLVDGALTKRAPQKRTRCAYCIALRALSNYQCALNHERLKTGYRTIAEQIERVDTLDQLDEVGTGLIMSNPLIVALTIVCHQLVKLGGHGSVGEWSERSKRLESLLRKMGREILLTSRTLSLTKEWWNIHDDTEQFVVRLQATCPTDIAFVPSLEVDAQLESYSVQAHLVWPRLQSRLGHFGFLRNAHLEAVAGLDRKTDAQDQKSNQTFRLECPTCLQPHSPSNPTFALLPGCWHTLCIACHDRIASSRNSAQRRCPICRTPFHSSETTGVNARRRRPLTLIHYTGDASESSVTRKSDDESVDCFVVGDHSSKVRAVIKCLKAIKENDADAKAIVFSSWLSVLVTIAGALDQNHLSYCTLFHPRDACCPGRLTGFQCFGSTTWILLMPIQLGANGLNLTSANHLLLVDPVLSHGREAQAIARMHRIGQTRPSVVHRFLVRDSIEAALHAAAHPPTTSSHDSKSLDWLSSTDCMIGAGSRRSAATPSGVAGPSEDRAQLMQLTLGQLAELLHSQSNSGMLTEELQWAESSTDLTI